MAFLIYRKEGEKLVATGESFSLAGYNLIYQVWESRGKPLDQGWHITVDELIKTKTKCKESYDSMRLIIDFHPSSKRRIGLVELLDVYVFTYSRAESQEASWSPMMLRLRDVLDENYDSELSKQAKEKRISVIDDPDEEKDFVEFLYLNGADRGWNWGKSGMTNGTFIYDLARNYFRQYF